ncbi:MAG: F0F1 ATP synthase subunit A [Myxococcales bacterium]|nr:F0F1 ATP synthase subunit A [Myxococcales bacterium]MCB9520757.1 F0F1 ATP synthase subunit A [Myxococcales bacterium]MCB9533474.1 F0F1 ATP synthase subunit A [Myxococcales bacterium]
MTFLASGFTWFNLIPGYDALEANVSHQLGDSFIDGEPVHSITHLTLTLFATAVVMVLVALTRRSWAAAETRGVPEGRFSVANLLETIVDTVLGLGEQVLGSRKQAERFLPLVGTLAIFIFFQNALALLPGFVPPTDNLNTTIGPAIAVFIATHYFGIKENGLHYLAHFLGPKIGGVPWLAPLFLLLETISHLARPISLALRLFGNMYGDHAVLGIFLGLAALPLLYPIPIMLLGTVVVVVQTLVFCLLTLVYIALAIEHSEEAH